MLMELQPQQMRQLQSILIQRLLTLQQLLPLLLHRHLLIQLVKEAINIISMELLLLHPLKTTALSLQTPQLPLTTSPLRLLAPPPLKQTQQQLPSLKWSLMMALTMMIPQQTMKIQRLSLPLRKSSPSTRERPRRRSSPLSLPCSTPSPAPTQTAH